MTIDDVQYVKYQAIISLIEKYQETWDGVRRSSFCVSKACRVHMYTSCRTIEGKVFLHFLVVTKRNTVDFSTSKQVCVLTSCWIVWPEGARSLSS